MPETPELPLLPLLVQRPGARVERADAARNRQAILGATEGLVANCGPGAVTMEAVACAAGVGKGTVFRRFGDRAGLLRALLDEHERELQDGFIRGPAPLGPGAEASERLVAFGHRLLDHLEVHGELLAAADGSPGLRLRHRVHWTYRTHVVLLVRAIAPDADAAYLADVLLGALAPDLFLFQRHDLDLSVERLKQGWTTLCAGVAPR